MLLTYTAISKVAREHLREATSLVRQLDPRNLAIGDIWGYSQTATLVADVLHIAADRGPEAATRYLAMSTDSCQITGAQSAREILDQLGLAPVLTSEGWVARYAPARPWISLTK